MFIEKEATVLTVRTGTKKGYTRKIRANNVVPGILYGKKEPNILVEFPATALEFAKSYADVFWVEVGGSKKLVHIKELQKHPVSRNPIHVDIQVIQENDLIDVSIPVKFTGKSKGVVVGGSLKEYIKAIKIRCLPRDIPASIDIDVTEMDIRGVLHLSDLPKSAQYIYTGKPKMVIAKIEGKADVVEAAPVAAAKPAAGKAPAKPAAAAAKPAAAAPAKKK